MNARVPASALTAPAAVALLAAGFVYDDTLTLDLYGRIEENGYCVTKVTVAGTEHNVTSLLRDRQLAALDRWLEVLNAPSKLPADWIEQHRRQASMYLESG